MVGGGGSKFGLEGVKLIAKSFGKSKTGSGNGVKTISGYGCKTLSGFRDLFSGTKLVWLMTTTRGR